MQAEVAAHRPPARARARSGRTAWASSTSSPTRATYIGDVSPYLPRGGVAGIAQSGSVADAFVHSGSRVGFSRIISCGSEVALDVCDFLDYCLDDPETSSVILFVEGFKRPERFLALADRALELGKPIMAVKVGRSEQAQVAAVAHSGSLAGEARATDAALDAAGVIRCADLDELLETAELVEGIRRTGRSIGRGRTGRRDGVDRRGVAHRRPGRSDRGRPAADPAKRRGRRSWRRSRRWATSATRWIHGAPTTPPTAYGATLRGDGGVRGLRRPGPSSTTSRTARCRPRWPRPTRSRRSSSRRRADRPSILPVYVSLTSGEPPPETKALLDEHGGGAPLLRGGRGGVHRDRERRPLGGPSRPARGRSGRGGPAGRRSPRTTSASARTRRRRPRRRPARGP